MLFVLLILGTCTLCAALHVHSPLLKQAAEEGIYPRHLQNNFQLSWPRDSHLDYAQAKTLTADLVDVTVSMWVKHRAPTDTTLGYFSYGYSGTHQAFRFSRSTHHYVNINGAILRCPQITLTTSWMHFLVTWSNIKGEVGVWVDGHKKCSGILKTGDTIKKGGNFTLGITMNNWDQFQPHPGYNARGEMAYVNVYQKFVNSTEDYLKLKGMTLSDPKALLPWEEFRHRTFGNVRILPEYDLYKDSFTHLECSANSMTLYLKRQGFQHLNPKHLVLMDGKCGPSSVNDTYITFATDLIDCGTLVNFTYSYALYTNEIRSIDAKPKVLTTSVDVINRRPVDSNRKRIGFKCEHELADRIHEPIYAPHINNVNNHGYGDNRFSYRVSLYHTEDYNTPYGKDEYPIQIEMEERVFVEVAVVGEETRLENWIDNCRATPSANYNDAIKYDLISGGCPNKADVSIKYHNSTDAGAQRFSFDTFRFNQFPSAVIFLHCDMTLCNPNDDTSRCAKGFSVC